MPRHLFFSAVALLLLVPICEAEAKQKALQLPDGVDVFASQEQGNYEYAAPSLAEVDGVLVAAAQARCSDCEGAITHIMERHALTSEWKQQDKWETHLVAQGQSLVNSYLYSFNPVMAVKEGRVYLLFKEQEEKKSSVSADWADEHSAVVLYTGTPTEGSGQSDKSIKWSNSGKVFSYLTHDLGNNFERFFMTGAGSGVVMGNGTVVFPMEALSEEAGKYLATVVYLSSDDKKGYMAKGVANSGCSYTTLVEYQDGKFLMMASCKDGARRVFLSSNLGETWVEALGTLSRVWGNSPKRTGHGSQDGLAAATIAGKRVFLLTHPVFPQSSSYANQIHLWLSDGTRIFDVGPISANSNYKAASSTLLYAKDKLFSLYERKEVDKQRFVLVRLDDQLERIKEVLAQWDKLEKDFSKSCTSLGVAGACDGSTRGVGLLSNAGSASHWNDEYLCVDAAVSGATKVADGFEFSGSNSRAEWPVGAQGQNQRYHFANYNFALLATVTVNDPTGGASVLGVRLNGTDSAGNRFGLLCSGDNNWVVKSRTGEKVAQAARCESKKQYRVLLTLQEGSFSFYINGEALKLAGADAAALAKKDSEEIAHFYFGADDGMSGVDGSVTVKNVFLMSRPEHIIESETPNNGVESDDDEDESSVSAHGSRVLLLLLGLWALAAFY
ncbi:trans-sialidase [Trypanosoma conorhini]|uniref:Trans-sialidase n=1 Tax=Trypanosoma conorhini TaxID=83891 RepID=A0A3R7N366_9TRYP|nr:trans-sialidase [Trypanosoma conorhini]RNE95678.1 trans-sialidase [Trypanosoma conorhini]